MPDIYSQTSIEDVIITAFAVIVILVLGGSIYSFIRAIFFFIFSGGKEDTKKKGRNSIRFMIIGVLLMVALLISFPYIIKSMDVKLDKGYSTKAVFSKAGELFGKIFELGSIVKQAQKEHEIRGEPYIPTDTTPATKYSL